MIAEAQTVEIIQILQNHRIICFSRDVSRSSCPSPLLKQGQLEQISQDCVQLNISTTGDSTAIWGSLSHCLIPSQHKRVFFCLNRISWVFYFVSCPLTGHCWEGSGTLFHISSHQVFIYIDKLHLSHLYSRLNSHNFQWFLIWKMLHSLHHFYGFFC